MKKKILMISGSPRKKGDGAKVLNHLASVLTENSDIECESLFLTDYSLEACRGCLVCQKKAGDNCPVKDDLGIIKEKMAEADGLVFMSPVYIRMISAQMKMLFDRLSFYLHRPVHAGKPALILCTSSYAGIKESLNYMKIPVGNMGMRIVDSKGVLSSAYKLNSEYKNRVHDHLNKTGKKITDDLLSEGKPRPSVKELFIFNKWKHKAMYHKKYYPGDFQFWEEKGWFDKDFYYPVRINPVLKLLIPFMVKKVMRRLSQKIGYLQ